MAGKKISKDTPLAELTLRRYERPSAQGRELVRRLCLSIGLLQPGDSRDVIVDVMLALLKAKEPLSSEDVVKKVIESRKKQKLEMKGIAASNIRRQILRIRNMMIVEKVANNYRITENETLTKIFEEKIQKYMLASIVERVKEYFEAVDKARL